MTKKETYELMLKHFKGEVEIVDFTEEELDNIIEVLFKEITRLNKPRKENSEAINFALGVATAMADDSETVYTAKELADKLEVSTAKVASAMKRLVQMDKVVKVPPIKHTDPMGYILA